MDLKTSMKIAAAGMNVQTQRIKVIAENIANAGSVSSTAGGDPYQRKTISFKNIMSDQYGTNLITVDKIGKDNAPFIKEYAPSHPSADEFGYIKLSNVNTMIEGVDMKEAQRSYEANLATIEVTKTMLNRTLDLLR